MARGLFVRGYMGFLRRFLYGFVEDDPSRRKPRRRRERPRKVRSKHPKPSPGPRFRVRKRFTLNSVSKFGAGSVEQLFGTSNWAPQFPEAQITPSSPYANVDVCQDYTNPGPPYRTGGEFTSVKVKVQPVLVHGVGTYNAVVPVNLGFGARPTRYRGGFYNPDFTGIDFSLSQYADPDFLLGPVSGFLPSLLPYHSVVDKKLRPILNRANLGQSLAEIREIPRMLSGSARDFHDYWRFLGGSPSSKRMSPKGASDSFLNAQFGWAPFIRDIGDVFDVVNNYDTYVRDSSKRNNRWDHRERVLEETFAEQPLASGVGMKVQPVLTWRTALYPVGHTWTERFSFRQHVAIRVWCSGDFKFYKPAFDMSLRDYDSGLNHLRRASTLLGTDISPSLLWKITPWTWLADWFGNVGNVIETATAAGSDGVVSKNVFLMMSWKRVITLLQEINMASGHLSMEFHREVDSKQRGHASTPYNFGLLPGSLTGKQLSILAALGISKFT